MKHNKENTTLSTHNPHHPHIHTTLSTHIPHHAHITDILNHIDAQQFDTYSTKNLDLFSYFVNQDYPHSLFFPPELF